MPYWDEHRETDIGHPVPGRDRMFAESDINLFFEIVCFYFFLTEFDGIEYGRIFMRKDLRQVGILGKIFILLICWVLFRLAWIFFSFLSSG